METQNTENKDSHINTPIQNMVADSQKDSKTGPLIGSIIVILVIIIGGLYFWGSLISSQKNQIEKNQIFEEQTERAQLDATVTQSTSDDPDSIESDIDATNIESTDSDFDSIEQEY